MTKDLYDKLLAIRQQEIKKAEERNRGDYGESLSKEDEEVLTRAWKIVAEEEESLIPDLVDEKRANYEDKVDRIVEQIIENLNKQDED